MNHHQAFLRHLQSLTDAEDLLRVCRAYKTATDAYAFELNGRLKGGLPLDKFTHDTPFLMRTICATLDNTITLYRMTSDLEFTGPLLHALKGPFRYHAFMSTAADSAALGRFLPSSGKPLLIEIEVPPGIALAPLDLFPGTEENEYLLGCGTTFQTKCVPCALEIEQARDYLPFDAPNNMELLKLKVVANPPYVNASSLVKL